MSLMFFLEYTHNGPAAGRFIQSRFGVEDQERAKAGLDAVRTLNAYKRYLVRKKER